MGAAFENQEKALRLLEESLGDDAENPVPRLDMATARREMGEIFAARRNEAEAQNNFRRALEILRKLEEENALGEIDKKQIGELLAKLSK